MKASRPCPLCRLALPGQRCGWCAGSGIVEIHFATAWDWAKWHLLRCFPLLGRVLGRIRLAPPSSPEGT